MNNNIIKMPDAYDKQPTSNLYTLLALAYGIAAGTQTDLNDIADSRDLQNAYGETLDNYGATYGVSRSGATDDQYRTKIRNKIAANTVGSDCNSIINAIATMFGGDPAKISIIESSFAVAVTGLTIEMLNNSGYTQQEIYDAIKSLLPAGIGLLEPYFGGTLQLFSRITIGATNYPRLYSAWLYGQEAYANGEEVGLSGDGTVPDEFLQYAPDYQASGTYEGGTLGTLGNLS